MWTPDGRRLLFTADVNNRPTVFSTSVDGSAPPEIMFTAPPDATDIHVEGFAPNRQTLLFYEGNAGQTDIGTASPGQADSPRIQVRPRSNEGAPHVSPDGRFIAYHSNVSGRFEVYVERYPEFSGRVQVSTQGGRVPLWSLDGGRLTWIAADGTTVNQATLVAAGDSLRVSTRRTIVSGAYMSSAGADRPIDIGPQGRYALLKPLPRLGAERAGGELIFLDNWFSDTEDPNAPSAK